VDLAHLDSELSRHADRPLKLGSFSAASNVTGIVTDVDAVARVLRRHGALACFDYAAAGPYLPIDMRGKHAVFISPHKFPGAPGTPGVLVAKRALSATGCRRCRAAGRSSSSAREHSYHAAPEVREEGGTPAIVESIRAGLVFALKEAVGAEPIRRREHDLARRALAAWGANPLIEILGDQRAERLAIVSLALRHGRDLLHSNFVVAVLSDLFGIQARSGCFCAGPYIHRDYPIDERWSERMHAEVRAGHMGAKLAFTRLSFPYFIGETAFRYVLDAVDLLAREGWKLLPLYSFDPVSGLWRHRDAGPRRPLSLRDALAPPPPLATAPDSVLSGQLEAARRVIAELEAAPPPGPLPDLWAGEAFERIRWFPLPGEGLAQLRAARR
jgi:selenocysteine lyase/cysteine desulfurase